MKQLLIITILFLFSCNDKQSKESQSDTSKIRMPIEVEITPVGENGFTIAWYDTLGKSQNLNILQKPFEIVCVIMDKHDTAGYYHGLSMPSTWTSYGTKDSIITVYFSIARNRFSDLPKERILSYPDIGCNFKPVQLNTRTQVRKRIPLILIEQ